MPRIAKVWVFLEEKQVLHKTRLYKLTSFTPKQVPLGTLSNFERERERERQIVSMRLVAYSLLFSFFLNFPFFFPCSFSSSDTISGGSCKLSWGGEGSPVRYNPGNFVGLISSELGVRARPPLCSTRRCSLGLLVGGRKHSVILIPWYQSEIFCYLSITPAAGENKRKPHTILSNGFPNTLFRALPWKHNKQQYLLQWMLQPLSRHNNTISCPKLSVCRICLLTPRHKKRAPILAVSTL